MGYAYVELAKHYEHRLRDYHEAQKWAQTALEQVKSGEMPAYIRRHWQVELEHRMERLEGKLKSEPTKRKKNV